MGGAAPALGWPTLTYMVGKLFAVAAAPMFLRELWLPDGPVEARQDTP